MSHQLKKTKDATVSDQTYKTIQGSCQAEIVEKKSRFIAAIAHVETEEEAVAFLESVKADHRMARHHVYAYVLHENGRVRYSDDGEPQKTAGLPTLEVIQHAGLRDIIIVTTRYFGGVLLGTGGLVRAYTQAAQAGIAAADVVEISQCVDVRVDLTYDYYEQAIRLTEQCGAKVNGSDFTDLVTLDLLVLSGDEETLITALNELTHGKAQIKVGEIYETAF